MSYFIKSFILWLHLWPCSYS